MRYHIQERLWALTETFLVRDERGTPVFEIRGKFFHIGDNLIIHDCYTRQPIAQIKQHLISLLPSYDIYRNGQHWARVNKQIHLFGEKFKIQGDNGMVFHIQGDLWNWDFSVTDAYGNHLGYISRQLSLIRDHYAVDVAPGVDAPFLIALAIVVDMVREHQREHREH
jgi:uncharacterized protein YxjI